MNQLASIKQSDFADFERQGWEQLSTAYSESWGHVTSAFVPAILASFPELEGKQLIDLATGTGYAASIASREGAIVTGIDFSVNMVVQARMAFPTIIFETADVEALPFGDETIEFSVSNFGFQHFQNPDKALREVLRVLKPRGALGFTVWAEAHRNAASLILEQALNRFAVVPCPIPEGPNYGEG